MSLINDIREVMEKQEYEKQSVHYTYNTTGSVNIKTPIDEFIAERSEIDKDGFLITSTKPKQYQIGIDTFARMEANCTLEEIMGFIKGNIDKYNFRKKNQDIEDFEKIVSYANWAIKQLKNQESINRLNP